MKKIWFVLPAALPFPPSKGGAVETLLQLFVEENEVKKKYNITVFSIYDKKAEEWSKKLKYTSVIYINSAYSKNWKNRLNNHILKLIGKKLPYLDEYTYAIKRKMSKMSLPSHCIIEGGGYRNFKPLIKLLGRNKLSLHVHAVCSHKFNANKYFGSFIFVSKAAEERWCVGDKYKSSVLMNAVDESIFAKSKNSQQIDILKEQYKIKKDDFVVLYCGRLTEQKGVLELVKAVRSIYNDKIKLLVVGSSNFRGADITEYQKQLEEYIGDFVIFTGFIDNHDLPLYYQLANVVVSPSLRDEAASLVNIEAMISGKALITTEQGGNIEYVNPEGAILIKNPEDKERLVIELSKSIRYLFDNPEVIRKMEESNKIYACKFTKKSYYENYSLIIDNLIDG